MLDMPTIRRRLAGGAAGAPPHDPAGGREAAVAVVLRDRDAQVELLFIRRAERPGDPWAGHMAFPGGHREGHDADLPAAAVRETREEIGLDISAAAGAALLGALPAQRPQAGRRKLIVAPFVFAVSGDPPLTLNHEVAAAVWAPLDPMHRGANWTCARLPFERGSAAFDGFRLEGGHFVWGLTYRVVQTLLRSVDPTWRGPRE